jgi:hypothetical protein
MAKDGIGRPPAGVGGIEGRRRAGTAKARVDGKAMFGFDVWVVIVGFVALIVGGLVKGAVGVGLPVVAIAVMSGFLPVPTMLALVVVPIVLTNLWQAVQAGNPSRPLQRFWPMIVCLLVFVWLSASLVVGLDGRVLYGLLGSILILFVVTDRFRGGWTVSPAAERWAAPLAGSLGGVLGGLSTIWGPPMMIYFVMLRLSKEMYIQTVGLVWFAASIPLVVAYVQHGILTVESTTISAFACLPAFIGLFAGQKLRHRFNQRTFRRILLAFLFLSGLNLLRRALF